MKTTHLPTICEAVVIMQRLMIELGVQNPDPIAAGHKIPAAKRFAEEIIRDSSRDRVAELTREHPESAQAFLFLLCVVHEEIKGGVTLPDILPDGSAEVYHTAAFAAERETVAFGNRRPFVTALGQ
jgi:tryptophan synthase alpha subunit